ncbi:MAG: hypothetical protein E7103_05340 [Prevotella sp.]|nr:hypothetical protein [Prevotella sp.]
MNLPAARAAQSPEITNALQQYTKSVGKYWEKTIRFLRNEALSKGISFSQKSNGGTFLFRTCSENFFRKIDPKHPERVIEAIKYVLTHPLVTQNAKGLFYGVNFVEEFEETDPGIYKLELSRTVVKHYLAGALTVEYDSALVETFKSKSAAVLYKKGCLVVSMMYGFFEMSEEEIRLLFSIDTVTDIDNLEKAKIKDISNLPILHCNTYERFDHLFIWLINPGLEEINEAYRNGKCPFCLRPETYSLKVRTGKRGPSQCKYFIRFHIEHPEIYIEAEEVKPIKEDLLTEQATNRTEAIQTELQFSENINEPVEKLSQIEKLLEKILKDSRGYKKFTKKYPKCITDQIRERLCSSFQSCLPDAVLAWIEYTQKEVKDPKGIARLLQAHLAEELCLVYEGKYRKGTKDHLKWDGKAPVKFPPDQEVSQEGKDNTDSSVEKDWYQVWTRCRNTAIKSAPEGLSMAFELMFYTNYSATEKKLTIQVPSFIIREYVLMIKKSEFDEIIKTNFSGDTKCDFVEKYNAGSAELLKKFQKLYEAELAKYRQQIDSVDKGRLEKLKEIWQECQTELGNRDKVFIEKVSLESYSRQSNTLLLRVVDKETYEYLENKYVSLMNEVFQRHFRVVIKLNYRINPERIEPQLIDHL